MKSARSCLTLLGSLALAVACAGCSGGSGPEAFAPAGTSTAAPVATNARAPVATGNPTLPSQRRFKQTSTQTSGPQEQP
jgi:hypothetical protein